MFHYYYYYYFTYKLIVQQKIPVHSRKMNELQKMWSFVPNGSHVALSQHLLFASGSAASSCGTQCNSYHTVALLARARHCSETAAVYSVMHGPMHKPEVHNMIQRCQQSSYQAMHGHKRHHPMSPVQGTCL